MSNLEEFTQELTALCNKYGYIISGKTVNGSVHIGKCDGIKCEIKSVFENGGYIVCKEEEDGQC